MRSAPPALHATILRPWYVLGPGRRWPVMLLPAYWLMGLLPDPGIRESPRPRHGRPDDRGAGRRRRTSARGRSHRRSARDSKDGAVEYSSVADPAQTLSKVPIFSQLKPDQLSFLTQRVVPRRYAAGELVFAEGDPCAGLYVVESGHIRIFKSSSGGREQVLSIDGPGSSVAELPVFDGGNYPASGLAVDDATLLLVRKQDFQALCLAHPEVALRVLRIVGARLRRLVTIIEELSFTTVRRRLASFLFRLAQHEGKRTADGIEITPARRQSGARRADRDRARARLPQSLPPAAGGHAEGGRTQRRDPRPCGPRGRAPG